MKFFKRFFRLPQSDTPITTLNTRARFPADELLERRIRMARDLMQGYEPKLIEDQPDTWPTRKPINYDEWL